MNQPRKPAGAAGSTGGQFDHDPKAGTGDLPGLKGRHVGHIPWMARLDHVDMSGATVDSPLDDATLTGCDLSHADLSGRKLGVRAVADTSFRDADMRGTAFDPYFKEDHNRYWVMGLPEFQGRIDLSGADLTGADLSSVTCPDVAHVDPEETHIIVSDATRLDGARVSFTAAGNMEHPDGTPVDWDELKRRGATLALEPDDNDLLDFEDERYRKATIILLPTVVQELILRSQIDSIFNEQSVALAEHVLAMLNDSIKLLYAGIAQITEFYFVNATVNAPVV